jgi:hypothetical protein
MPNVKHFKPKGDRSTLNAIRSLLTDGFEEIAFVVGGKEYLIRAEYDEKPVIKAELLAAEDRPGGGFVERENGEQYFIGKYVDQDGHDYPRGDKPQPWRSGSEILSRKIIMAAYLHRARHDELFGLPEVAEDQPSAAELAAKGAGPQLSPDILRALLDQEVDMVEFGSHGGQYLIVAHYDERPLIKVELLAASEHTDTGIALRNEHEELFVGNFVDEDGHEYPDQLEPVTWQGASELLARKLILGARLHQIRTATMC